MATEKFAEGTCFKKLFFVFIFGCVFGCFYEMILNFCAHLIWNHEIFWETRSGVIYGPFSIIYGLGAVILTYVFTRRKFKWWQIFLLGGLIGGVFEVFVGYIQEIFTGTSSWNYGDHWLNIAGKTSPRIMFVWGFICLVYMLAVYPAFSNLIEKIPSKIGDFIFWALLAFIIADCFISFTAVVRMNLRHHNVPVYTPYGRFLDHNYSDARIHRAYPNMVELEE